MQDAATGHEIALGSACTTRAFSAEPTRQPGPDSGSGHDRQRAGRCNAFLLIDSARDGPCRACNLLTFAEQQTAGLPSWQEFDQCA